MKAYKDLLKHPLWQKKRLEVMQLHNFRCQLCGAGDKELQIHHPRYIKGRKPYEYDSNELMCVCSDCHRDIHYNPDASIDNIIHEFRNGISKCIYLIKAHNNGTKFYTSKDSGFWLQENIPCDCTDIHFNKYSPYLMICIGECVDMNSVCCDGSLLPNPIFSTKEKMREYIFNNDLGDSDYLIHDGCYNNLKTLFDDIYKQKNMAIGKAIDVLESSSTLHREELFHKISSFIETDIIGFWTFVYSFEDCEGVYDSIGNMSNPLYVPYKKIISSSLTKTIKIVNRIRPTISIKQSIPR